MSYYGEKNDKLLAGEAMRKDYQTEYESLGLNIAYYRKKHGLSQRRLGDMLGISRTHMSRIETARCSVSLDVVFGICKIFEISPKELFDFRE